MWLKKLTKSFGVDSWKNTIIVLTFANVLEAIHVGWELLAPEKKATVFQSVIQEWRDQIQEIFTLELDAKVPKEIIDKVQVVPAGHYLKHRLPDREYWLSALWFKCLDAIPTHEGRAALIKINQARFKRTEDVKDTDFQKEAENQPIVIDNKYKNIVGILGTYGGPLAIIPLLVYMGYLVVRYITRSKHMHKDIDDVDGPE